ncbi:MAG: aquaporin [Candidatus Eremiobacteraeota bacterium]|nr:aquaporin [Candidatus Eremiobacteraeota bacterium]
MELEVKKPSEPSLGQKLLAEFAGTFFLTFVAAGADVIDAGFGGAIGHVARYLAPGLLVLAMIYALSGISGAHINPAVTLGFVLRKCFPAAMAVWYWIVQFAGAIVAAFVLRMFFGPLIMRGANGPGPAMNTAQAVGFEAILTLLLVIVILATSEQKPVVGKNAALAVGFTVALCGLFSSPVSGASMNPARSLGPAIVSGHMHFAWIYIVGPAVGACFAVALAYGLLGPTRPYGIEAAQGAGSEAPKEELVTASH